MITNYIELLEIIDKIISEEEYKLHIIDVLIDFKPKIYHYTILNIINKIIEDNNHGYQNDVSKFILLKNELVTKLKLLLKK